MTQNMAGTRTVLSSAILMLFGVAAFTQAIASTLKHSTLTNSLQLSELSLRVSSSPVQLLNHK